MKLVEKPYIKCLNNIDMLRELPFYNELNTSKTSAAFKGYARSYSIEIIYSKDPPVQLISSKSNFEGLFKDLLNEIKGFQHQISLLSKHKKNTDREFASVYFNSISKFLVGLIIGLMNDLDG